MSKEFMQQNIEKAQREIAEKKGTVARGKMRQRYHFMAQTGWLNDPNGLIYFRGKYHFFFQYNPYHGFWDRMHWGHATSEDLLHWEYQPLALAPSESYDDHPKGGCFSGSAIERDGKLYLMYTGSVNRGNGFEQTQCIAYSEDGIHFEKYAGNPVITVPDGVPSDLFRDPKVWKHGDTYYMVCGASRNRRGMALLYRSEDLLHWDYFNILAESRGEWGFMWECPDFFEMDGKYVLTFSPMGSGDHTSVYLVGDFDYETGRFDYHISGEMDWGFDYYAPQSFLAPDGRRITVTWANEWEWMPLFKDWGPTYQEGWCGSFNVLREVRMKEDGTLFFPPIKEMENLRMNPWKEEHLAVGEDALHLPVGDGVAYEMRFWIDLEETDADVLELHLRCGGADCQAADGKQAGGKQADCRETDGKQEDCRETVCRFDFRGGTLQVDRNRSDGWSRGVSESVLMLRGKKELDVHVLSDQSSLEIFTDQYQNNHSNNVFAGDEQNGLWIRACGGRVVLRDLETYGLRECFERDERRSQA